MLFFTRHNQWFHIVKYWHGGRVIKPSPPLSLSVSILSGRDVYCQETRRSKGGDAGKHNLWANVHIAEKPPIILVVDVDAAMVAIAMPMAMSVAMAVAVRMTTTMAAVQKCLIAPLSVSIYDQQQQQQGWRVG